jgi:DNA-binding MarR family transcriptional regulator
MLLLAAEPPLSARRGLDSQENRAYTLSMADYSQLARKIAKECTGMRVRQVSRLLTRIYDERLRPLGIQESQLSVLVAVSMFGENGATMGALAGKLVMDRTTLTRNVVPLEKAGLLRVARSAADARARVILLTRAGERLIESAYPLWEKAQRRIRRTLGEERFEALLSQLSEVVTFADKLELGGAAG